MQNRDQKFLFPTNPQKDKGGREDQISAMEKHLEATKAKQEKISKEFYDFSEFSNLDMQMKEAKKDDYGSKLTQVQSALNDTAKLGLDKTLPSGADAKQSIRTLL